MYSAYPSYICDTTENTWSKDGKMTPEAIRGYEYKKKFERKKNEKVYKACWGMTWNAYQILYLAFYFSKSV